MILLNHISTIWHSFYCFFDSGMWCYHLFLFDMPYHFIFQDMEFYKSSPLKLILGYYLVQPSLASSLCV